MTTNASNAISEAQLIALFVECILYGVFLVSLGHCLRALLFIREDVHQGLKIRTNINWKLFVIALLLCLFATLDIAFGLRHCLDAFIYYDGPAEEEFNDSANWVSVMKVCRRSILFSSAVCLYLPPAAGSKSQWSDYPRRRHAGEYFFDPASTLFRILHRCTVAGSSLTGAC